MPMNAVILEILKKITPQKFYPSAIIRKIISEYTNNKVFLGPFAGMKLHPSAVPVKYLLGTYELELHQLIEYLCKQSFDTIVNVGAETGYYAVGLALRNPNAKVIAFEAIAIWHNYIRKVAEINSVGNRIVIEGTCDAAKLKMAILGSKQCLILVDCEGGECNILNPLLVPQLAGCYILVELHEFILNKIPEIMAERFGKTHRIVEVWSRARKIADFPIKLPPYFQIPLLEKYCIKNMDEGRPEQMRWFYLEPNTHGH